LPAKSALLPVKADQRTQLEQEHSPRHPVLLFLSLNGVPSRRQVWVLLLRRPKLETFQTDHYGQKDSPRNRGTDVRRSLFDLALPEAPKKQKG
jgi:hypothetical protein